MGALRIFLIQPERSSQELARIPDALPDGGFLWLAFERSYFGSHVSEQQEALHRLTGFKLLDLHVSDLLNLQLRSHFDYTSNYDMLVFRRLADNESKTRIAQSMGLESAAANSLTKEQGSLPHLARKLQTQPVGFVVFDRVLVSVHPQDCKVLEAYIKRFDMLAQPEGARASPGAPGVPAGMARLPDSPAELMLRMVSLMIDDYLDLRRFLSRQLDRWQQQLMRPNARFDDWEGLLQARQSLHHLYDICEDQRNAVGRWMDILEDWPKPTTAQAQHRHDQLLVRSRDVLEHIERVSHHVQMLEQSAETAVQIHFNIQNNRTNDVMRTLTAITAVFLPLNLIAGIFGMNFEFIPWLHSSSGFWWSLMVMALIALLLIGYFVRKRYLSSSDG